MINLLNDLYVKITCGLLIPLVCSVDPLSFAGLPRLFLLSSPFVDGSSCFFGGTTTALVAGTDSPVFDGRPRARFGASESTTFFVEPADFGGRPRPFFPLTVADLFSPSSKSNIEYLFQIKQILYHAHHYSLFPYPSVKRLQYHLKLHYYLFVPFMIFLLNRKLFRKKEKKRTRIS